MRCSAVHLVPAEPCPGDPAVALRALADGPRAALEALARWAHPVIARQARRLAAAPGELLLGRDELIEEVVAEVQAFLATGAGDGRPGWCRYDAGRAGASLEGWLFGIVRNKVHRRVRGARRAAAAHGQLSAVRAAGGS